MKPSTQLVGVVNLQLLAETYLIREDWSSTVSHLFAGDAK